MRSIVFILALMFSTSLSAKQLVIESWLVESAGLWENKIIPAFNKKYPDIEVIFRTTSGAVSVYENELKKRLEQGTAGDLILCRPFDPSLKFFKEGHLADITEMAGLENFPSFAQEAWQTDSGAQNYCLPMASVIHGFFYNKRLFAELGLTEPRTESEFFAMLETVRKDGRYVPLALGTKDRWEASTMGFQNIGPNFWHGEDGRQALIDGTQTINSSPYERAFEHMARWQPYLGDNYQEQSYTETNKLFTSGEAVVYAAGSWSISQFKDKVDLGVFAPPLPDNQKECFFNEHTDLGMGINAHSKQKADAMLFLEWMTTSEFASLYTNAEPGFFSLSNHFIEVNDPTARTMLSWREECDSSIRNSAQILSRGTPNFDLALWDTTIEVINGTITPRQAVELLQESLSSWYEPQRQAQQRLETNNK